MRVSNLFDLNPARATLGRRLMIAVRTIVKYNQATEKFGLSDYVQIHPHYAYLFDMLTLEILTRTKGLLSKGLLK
jgi:hypothetical protein